MPSASGDLYAILGASPGASLDELKRAYRKAALSSHPDKHPDDPSASERFREVHKAWQGLSDKSRRAAYDAGKWQDGRTRGDNFGEFLDKF